MEFSDRPIGETPARGKPIAKRAWGSLLFFEGHSKFWVRVRPSSIPNYVVETEHFDVELLQFAGGLVKDDTWAYYDELVPGWCVKWEEENAKREAQEPSNKLRQWAIASEQLDAFTIWESLYRRKVPGNFKASYCTASYF